MTSTLTSNHRDDEILKILADLIIPLYLTYNNTCTEISGVNMSNVDSIPISILNLKEQRTVTDLNRDGSNFMWKKLLIDCLISMDYQDNDDPEELVQLLTSITQGKHSKNEMTREKKQQGLAKIKEFQTDYKSTEAIRWYKEQSPVYEELNKALRLNCINRIFTYRFFIRDLSFQLQEEQKKFPRSNGNTILIYRGERTSSEQIDQLKNLKAGVLISVDSFLSTTRSVNSAKFFMDSKKENDELIPLRWEIQCDLTLETQSLYADISSPDLGSFAAEEEILFMVGTMFKFKRMFYDEKLQHWRLKVELFDDKRHRLAKLYQSIRDEMGEDPTILTLGGLLVQAGEHEHAIRIYMRSFFDLLISHSKRSDEYNQLHMAYSLNGIASVLCELGEYNISIRIFDLTLKFMKNQQDLYDNKDLLAELYYEKSSPLLEKGNYEHALKQCKYALNIFKKQGEYNSLVANCYEMMGNIYGDIGRSQKANNHHINQQYQYFEKANQFYQKALEIRKNMHRDIPDHFEICSTYINIGELYRDIGKSDEALEYTKFAYDGFVKSFPKSHNWIGIALDNIGEIYVLQKRFDEAREKYDEAIDVYKQTLPNDHRFIGETYHNIGKLYCCINAFDKALHYFKEAKKIYKKKIPDKHHLAAELHKQIDYANAQLH